MKKKMLSGALTATLLFTLPLGAMAAPEPEILINGQRLDSPQAPVIQNGRTLVPFRAIAQGLGAAVHYDAPTKQITAAKGDTILVLTLNGRTMIVNGQEKTLDVPPSLINNYTMLPARAFTEALGGTVAWENGQIIITTVEETTVEETVQELTDAALGKVTLAKHYLDEELKYWSLSVQGREVARIAEDGSYFHGNSVVILAAEAVSRSWYVLGGGRIGDRWETFERDGIPYRYLGEDLSTKKKLTSYLSVVFTEEAVAAFLRDYGIIENQGRMAQPDADGGSLLEWDKASASLIDEGDDWKRYELKVPYPVGDDVEYEVVQIKVQLSDQGWLLDSLVF